MPAAAANAADDQGVASSRVLLRFLARGPHAARIRWSLPRLSEISRRRFSDALGRARRHRLDARDRTPRRDHRARSLRSDPASDAEDHLRATRSTAELYLSTFFHHASLSLTSPFSSFALLSIVASQEYLDMGRVKKVDLYENGTIAIVEAVSPELGNRVQRVRRPRPRGAPRAASPSVDEKNIVCRARQRGAARTRAEHSGPLAFPSSSLVVMAATLR